MSVIAHRSVSVPAALTQVGARVLLKPLIAAYPLRSWSLRPLALAERIADAVPWTPSGVDIQREVLAGVEVERITPQRHDARDDAALVYFHGGAFLAGGPATHRRLAAVLARALGVAVYNVHYRQLPEVGIGTSVEDAYRVYRALADSRYEDVLLGGDSAGGYLCAKVIELAYLDVASRPAAFVGYSPLLNPTVADDDPRGRISDAYITVGKLRSLRMWFDLGPDPARGVDDAVTVPVHAFPPTLLVAASGEMLRIDSERLHGRLDDAGQECDLHLFDGGVHAFPVLTGLTPESMEAVRLAVSFCRSVLAHRVRRSAA
ncbi:alpha/beta hydrolase [Tsukamurella sp. 8F]|uniref:alpha/beta hydrolase n=1 Tax=unclassified Tsukamurella TaxID=2633480 RepID=UPI0023B9B06A|nr:MULTISPECIES: alpha/beta hydrolase [unclassified Tsukamurella]MDF0530979.1 alpha/beta hydrolase [Tsukamurella sp. 8J]MDF0588680.1 alpha/beta hydrolase [Tsukamurella sp. 8F]